LGGLGLLLGICLGCDAGAWWLRGLWAGAAGLAAGLLLLLGAGICGGCLGGSGYGGGGWRLGSVGRIWYGWGAGCCCWCMVRALGWGCWLLLVGCGLLGCALLWLAVCCWWICGTGLMGCGLLVGAWLVGAVCVGAGLAGCLGSAAFGVVCCWGLWLDAGGWLGCLGAWRVAAASFCWVCLLLGGLAVGGGGAGAGLAWGWGLLLSGLLGWGSGCWLG